MRRSLRMSPLEFWVSLVDEVFPCHVEPNCNVMRGRRGCCVACPTKLALEAKSSVLARSKF